MTLLFLCPATWAQQQKDPLKVEAVFNPNLGGSGRRANPANDRSVRGAVTLLNQMPKSVQDVSIRAYYVGADDQILFTEELTSKVDSRGQSTVGLYWSNPGGAYVLKMDIQVDYTFKGQNYSESVLLETPAYDPLANPEGY